MLQADDFLYAIKFMLIFEGIIPITYPFHAYIKI